MSNKLVKCAHCDLVIWLEQRSVRCKNEWFHFDCFGKVEPKQKPTAKPIIAKEKPTIQAKKPIVKTYSASPKPAKIQTSTYKAKVISESIYNVSKPESIIPKHVIQTIPKQTEKPAKPVEDTKPRHQVDLEPILESELKPTQKPTPRKISPDPALVVLAVAIFSLLFFAAYMIYTLISVISITIAGIIAFYHVLSRKSPDTQYKYKAKGASFYTVAILVMPFAFGIINAIDVIGAFDPFVGLEKFQILNQGSILDSINRLDGQHGTNAIIQAIFVWSLTLSFWQTMLFVPLAIRSAAREESLQDPKVWPRISVIVPAYNEEKVIQTTIESLLATDYPDKEIIVVDDGSKDNTLNLAMNYKEKIKVIHKENGGKASALNQGLLYTTGDIVTIVDADTIIGNSSLKHIARAMTESNVAAAAGNVKIRNKTNWLTWCQSLEYLSGIQIMRRGLDYFGAITIVPGALGAFRKKNLEEAGTYHKDTLVEDFDATLKVLRSGMIVNGSNKAVAYTQAPPTFGDFYKQRKRWYRGNLQVLKRHSDILLNPRFGYLHSLSYPLMAIHMLVVPFASFLVWAFAIYQIMQGDYFFVAYTLGMYITLQYLLSAMAVRMDKDDKKMILYSIFLVIGYKQIIDWMQIKAVIEEIFGKKAIWTSAQRVKQ
ncbi:MAG: glycosyltransferase [Nitrosopumilaceae archaeon]|nr:glycosyltransferase [Nitrosopumilaceae archaeon]